MCGLLFLLIASIIGVYLWIKSKYTYWENKKVPFAKPTFYFGSMLKSFLMKESFGQLYERMYREFPNAPYVGFYKMTEPAILVRDPNLLNDVLVKNFNSFHDNDFNVSSEVDPLAGKNPFFAKGEEWKRTRSQITQCFSSGKMKAIFHIMQTVSKNFVDFIDEESRTAGDDGLETKEICSKFTTDNVVNCAFGLEANCFKDPDSKYREISKKLFAPNFWQGLLFFIAFVCPGLATMIKLKLTNKETGDYFTNMVANIMKYREKNNVKRNDFFDNILELKNKYSEYGIDDMTSHAISLYIDGTETSSHAISFVLYDLAVNLESQTKLRQEINDLIAKDNVTYEGVLALPFLDGVMNETLRLHTPATFNVRKATEDFTFPSPRKNAEPLVVKKGTAIAMSYMGLHTDEKFFPEPTKYDPERFVGDRKNDIVKYSFLPFGDGPRVCVGQRFAVMQLKIAVFNVIANYEIRVSTKTQQPLEYDPKSLLLTAKGGLWLKYHRIQK